MLDFLGSIGHLIMTPLYYAVSAIMVAWHWLFTELGLDPDAGGTWALSIIGLTLVVRAMLIPLFVKQIKSSRNMQLIQPKVKELQKKYGHDRERLAAETMALYKETGTNPFASCLPILVQMPIFLALFRMLDQAAKHGKAHGFLNEDLAESFGNSKLFGTIPIKDTFLNNGGNVGVMVMAAILVVAMTATTFLTQRQLMSKNMPADALTGPYAQQQKLLLYVLPVVFAVGGIAFPIGVLLYWTTSNLWTMGQQFYVIRNNPAPGTPAFAAKQKRDAGQGEQARVGARGHRHGGRAGARATARRPPPAAQEADPPATQEGRAPAGHPQEPGRHRMSDQTQTETTQTDTPLHDEIAAEQLGADEMSADVGPDSTEGADDGSGAGSAAWTVPRRPASRRSSARVTWRPTTSRSSSTSPTSTATWTWTSTATGRRSRSWAPTSASSWASAARCWTRCRS